MGGNAISTVQHISIKSGCISSKPNVPSLPYDTQGACATTDKSHQLIFVAGGVVTIKNKSENTNHINVFYSKKMAWHSLPDMKTKRKAACAFVLDNILFVAGGEEEDCVCLKSVESINFDDPKTGWKLCTNLPCELSRAATVTISGATYESVLLSGGYKLCQGASNNVFKWKPGWSEWIPMPGMLQPRDGHSMCADGGKVWAVGGSQNATLEEFNVETDQWTDLCSMPFWRADTGAVFCSRMIILAGGVGPEAKDRDARPRDSVYVYNITSNTWSIMSAKLDIPVFDCCSVLIT